jgi:hypothetical protein
MISPHINPNRKPPVCVAIPLKSFINTQLLQWMILRYRIKHLSKIYQCCIEDMQGQDGSDIPEARYTHTVLNKDAEQGSVDMPSVLTASEPIFEQAPVADCDLDGSRARHDSELVNLDIDRLGPKTRATEGSRSIKTSEYCPTGSADQIVVGLPKVRRWEWREKHSKLVPELVLVSRATRLQSERLSKGNELRIQRSRRLPKTAISKQTQRINTSRERRDSGKRRDPDGVATPFLTPWTHEI